MRLDKLLIPASFTLLMMGATTADAENFAQFDTRFRYDSNVGNAKQAYIVSDSSLRTSFSFGKQHSIDDSNFQLSYGGKLFNESFNELTGLSRSGAGVQLSGRQKFGIGPYAPSLSLSWTLDRQAFNDSDRNGKLQHLELKASKRLSESLQLWATISSEKNHADHQERVEYYISGASFETSNRILTLNLDLAQNAATIWNISYALRRGDVLVSTIADLEYNYAIARAIRPDKSFGANRDVYRLNGSTQTLTAGVSHSLNQNWSMNLQLQKNWTRIPQGANYQRDGISLSASYQF